MPKAHMFLCHSHKDKPFVRKLAGHLSHLGVHIWMDEWELEPGDSLHSCIGRALDEAAYIGIVLSPDSVASKWCRSELDHALTREKSIGRKVAIPLLYRDVKPPPFLAGRQFVDFSQTYFAALTQVAGFLHQLPARELTEAINSAKLKKIDDSISCLESAGWKGIKWVDRSKYERLRKSLKESGVNVGSHGFEVIVKPPPKSGAGKKRATTRRRYLLK